VCGQLVSVSIDIYLALEYANGGDLFNLRGQLTSEEVRLLMWQVIMQATSLVCTPRSLLSLPLQGER
jgi:hypothetical protein